MTQTEYIACVDKYSKTVYRVAYHYFGNREDAEDITQDAFIKLFNQEKNWENEEEIKAWLIGLQLTCATVVIEIHFPEDE